MTGKTDGHVSVTRRQWDEHMSAWFERYARPRWMAAEPYWGLWCIPQSQLPVLPAGVAGAAVAELGCGSGYVSAWLARRGARPVGVDVSARQLATARRLQDEFGLHFPLIQGDAERVPLSTGCADLVISEYGASVWCDPVDPGGGPPAPTRRPAGVHGPVHARAHVHAGAGTGQRPAGT